MNKKSIVVEDNLVYVISEIIGIDRLFIDKNCESVKDLFDAMLFNNSEEAVEFIKDIYFKECGMDINNIENLRISSYQKPVFTDSTISLDIKINKEN